MLRRPLVLAVDDEPDIVQSMQAIIETELGHTVLTATSGPQALLLLEAMEGDGVDLILADYRMDPMDGITFLRRARELCPDTPRMLVTAFPDLDLAVNALNEAGILMFLSKPVEPTRLIDAVRQLVGWNVARKNRLHALRRAAGHPVPGGPLRIGTRRP